MDLRHLLAEQNIEPETALILRHTAANPKFARVLPWIATERQDLFNAYQQAQSPKVEKTMTKAKHVVSFIGQPGGLALLVGVYNVEGWAPMSLETYSTLPAITELRALGDDGLSDERDGLFWFDLKLQDALSAWKGKLVVEWPAPQILWYRALAKASMPVRAIHADNALALSLPAWHDLDLSWSDLKVLPGNLRAALAQWRGVYFIFDTALGKGYVGSAAGQTNLLVNRR